MMILYNNFASVKQTDNKISQKNFPCGGSCILLIMKPNALAVLYANASYLLTLGSTG